MTTVTIFRFLILLAFTSIPGCQFQQLPSENALSLSKELAIFEHCSVDLVNTAIFGKSPYNVEPLSIPLVRSIYYYKKERNRRARGVKCNNVIYSLAPDQGFNFTRRSLPPRFTCQVEIYITPPSCSNLLIKPTVYWNQVVPKSHFDFVNENLGSYSHEINRLGRFFILVSNTLTSMALNSIFYVVDMKYETYSEAGNLFLIPKPKPQVQFKTKLYFKIRRSFYNGGQEIESTFLVSRPGNPSSPSRYECLFQRYSPFFIANPTMLAFMEQFPDYSEWKLLCYTCYQNGDSSIPLGKSEIPGDLRGWTYKSKFPVEAALLQMIISPNSTIRIGRSFVEFLPQPGVEFPSPQLIISGGTETQQQMSFKQGYHFVTCSRPRHSKFTSIASIVFLIQAFDGRSWFCILISCVGSGIAMLLILRHKKDKFALLNPTAVLVFAFTLLLDHHSGVLNKSKFIGGTWLFMVIILVCCYEGNTVQQIIAPPYIKQTTSFEQTFYNHFSIYSHNVDTLNESPDALNSILKNNIIDIDKEAGSFYRSNFEEYFVGVRAPYNLLYGFKQMIYETIMRPRNFEEAMAMHHSGYFVNILERCDNDAYIGDFDSAVNMYLELKRRLQGYQAIVFSTSLQEVSKSWLFYNIPWPVNKYEGKVRFFSQSGVADLWINWNRKRFFSETDGNHRENRLPAVVTMGGEKFGKKSNGFVVPFGVLVSVYEGNVVCVGVRKIQQIQEKMDHLFAALNPCINAGYWKAVAAAVTKAACMYAAMSCNTASSLGIRPGKGK
ncbi:unnamed protein product [Orchesella dallaii]|uniref:Uncharacterized protein n=1 Tax=Orchesella dallaii TaxID=48710 RepID=A0ABP1S839_9HEXA